MTARRYHAAWPDRRRHAELSGPFTSEDDAAWHMRDVVIDAGTVLVQHGYALVPVLAIAADGTQTRYAPQEPDDTWDRGSTGRCRRRYGSPSERAWGDS
jgi:hypothetical protein